eukprot:TRINITY_DN17283_c0_g1_i1.p4 TRINITY_DN17283_c0_g1~~TRINITY_DN17283_c0_g1_i1.p4  ORF type:complete len:151 (+),score=24.23 TRINITY_DN17283_c0_g1_i1:1086-1538(+)
MDLQWQHVNFERGYLWIPISKNDPNAVGTYVTLFPSVLASLRRYRATLPPNLPPTTKLFSIHKSVVNPWLKRICTDLQLPPYTWYSFKHGGATWLALCGWTLPMITTHGRWKSKHMALVYIHCPVYNTPPGAIPAPALPGAPAPPHLPRA